MGRRPARFVEKPWGHEEIFAETSRYVGKILCIKAGEALSLQYHETKEETLRMLDGVMDLTAGADLDSLKVHRLSAGDVFHVPPRYIHRMTAITDCTMIEASTPELDDVVRLDDRYGRQGTNAP
jgi:mannose-6-phosphate isomerase-like protein (cupin superfamily)